MAVFFELRFRAVGDVAPSGILAIGDIMSAVAPGAYRLTMKGADRWRRDVGRRMVVTREALESQLALLAAGERRSLWLLCGHPHDSLDLASMGTIGRGFEEDDDIGAPEQVFLRIAIRTHPTDYAMIARVVEGMVACGPARFGLVHATTNMTCAMEDRGYTRNLACLTVPAGTLTREERVLALDERPSHIYHARADLGRRMLDVYWGNLLSGDLLARVRQRLEGQPNPTWTFRPLTDREDAALLTITPEPRSHDDPEFLAARSRVRALLRDECILGTWRGFV